MLSKASSTLLLPKCDASIILTINSSFEISRSSCHLRKRSRVSSISFIVFSWASPCPDKLSWYYYRYHAQGSGNARNKISKAHGKDGRNKLTFWSSRFAEYSEVIKLPKPYSSPSSWQSNICASMNWVRRLDDSPFGEMWLVTSITCTINNMSCSLPQKRKLANKDFSML